MGGPGRPLSSCPAGVGLLPGHILGHWVIPVASHSSLVNIMSQGRNRGLLLHRARGRGLRKGKGFCLPGVFLGSSGGPHCGCGRGCWSREALVPWSDVGSGLL